MGPQARGEGGGGGGTKYEDREMEHLPAPSSPEHQRRPLATTVTANTGLMGRETQTGRACFMGARWRREVRSARSTLLSTAAHVCRWIVITAVLQHQIMDHDDLGETLHVVNIKGLDSLSLISATHESS